MISRRDKKICWAASFVMTCAMFAVIFLWLDPRYAVNDDSGILRPFMGFETGTPAHFHIFIHGILAWPLHWLGVVAPGVAWFSWMQLAFLFLAAMVCQKSIMLCFGRARRPLWQGGVAALVFSLAYLLTYATRITFTQTAALLGAAAVLQILSVDHENGSTGEIVRGMALALVLCVLAYGLRQITALSIVAFCALAALYAAARYYDFGRKKSPKPLLRSAALFATVFVLLAAGRECEIDRNGARDYLRWQDATVQIMDRYGLGGIPTEELERVGWSENTASLISSQWFFLDESISTEAFEQLTDYVHAVRDESPAALIQEGMALLARFPQECRTFMPSLWLLAALVVLAVAGAAFLPKGKRWKVLAVLICGVLLALAMLLYLAVFKGRLPLRAALMALLPCAALLLGVLPDTFSSRGGTVLTALSLAVSLPLCAWYLCVQIPLLLPDEEYVAEVGDPVSDLLEYALSEEDMLIIHDITLAGDLRLFPDTSEGIPHNVSCWGGWSLRSAESIQQFENFGIDLLNFPPETFLREDVLFATGVVDPPPERLLEYLREKVDPDCDYTIYSEYGGVYFFQFY